MSQHHEQIASPSTFGGTPELLTAAQVAAAIGVTERTVSSLWRRNDGPIRTRIGGRVFVNRSDLAAWLASKSGRVAA